VGRIPPSLPTLVGIRVKKEERRNDDDPCSSRYKVKHLVKEEPVKTQA